MTDGASGDAEDEPRPFSRPVYAQITLRWRAWKNGIPPGREWRGLGAQNPHLLLAFSVLDRAEERAGRSVRLQSPVRKG
jgi:hypothetical protein